MGLPSPSPLLHGALLDQIFDSPTALVRLRERRRTPVLLLLLLLTTASLLTTSYYGMKAPDHCDSFDVKFSCIKGLALLRFKPVLNGHGDVSVICNPSTGQSFVLPKLKTRRRLGVRSYLGYDPVEKQHKVLSMTWLYYGSKRLVSGEHQVLTLGGKKPSSWRKIECSITYTSNYKHHHVCIDGVLYYPAQQRSTGDFIIVCFDVRSEKFSFVKDTDNYTQLSECAALKNYNGKLASLWPKTISGSSRSIRLRVLEDVDKEEWSQQTYILPDVWRNIVGKTLVRFVGVTRTKEIVFLSSSFQCLLYFDTERYTVVRVGIQGMEAVKHLRMFMFQDHVEDVKLMEVF